MKITAGTLLLTLTLGTVVCGALPFRAVFETGHPSQLIWHDSEAFVFLVHGQSGRTSSYAYQVLSIFSAFGVPTQDHRKSTTVFHITSDEIEEHHLDGPPSPWLIAADGYVSSYNARWIGGRFEPYVPRKIPEAFAQIPAQEFSDVEGWSKRSFMFLRAEGAKPVEFQLQGRPARLIISGDAASDAIDLERADMPVTRLMSVNKRLRRVSRVQYNQIFRK